MIEKALDALTLHLIWKAKGLLASEGSEADHYKEVILEQREALIDKLKEYAVGSQSNTAEAVKRAVGLCSSALVPILITEPSRPSNTCSTSMSYSCLTNPHNRTAHRHRSPTWASFLMMKSNIAVPVTSKLRSRDTQNIWRRWMAASGPVMLVATKSLTQILRQLQPKPVALRGRINSLSAPSRLKVRNYCSSTTIHVLTESCF